jgi:uncharacterized protein
MPIRSIKRAKPGKRLGNRDESRLEVILKVAERCNINCSYCYFFNGSDKSFRTHPPAILLETARATAAFLREGSHSLGLKAIRIDFHGGEPLLIGKRRFADVCKIFVENLPPAVNLTLSVQTNATLVDSEWIDIFQRYHVRVGVSLDGPPEYNDRDRVDFRGKGTHSSTVRGLRLLQDAAEQGRINRVGVLCVINPRHSARRIYRYFVDDLKIKYMDFLLPDSTYETFDGQPKAYGAFLCELFDTWVGDDDPNIQVRTLSSVMSLMLGGRSWVDGYGRQVAPAVTIGSDGSLQPNDLLRACGSEMMASSSTVTTTTLEEFLNSKFLRKLQFEYEHVCRQCRTCCWFEVCGGGLMVHRYRKRNRFNNPSVLCEGLMDFYSRVGAYLVKKGLPLERLQDVLLKAA